MLSGQGLGRILLDGRSLGITVLVRKMLKGEMDDWSRNKQYTEEKREEEKNHFILTRRYRLPPSGEGSAFTTVPMA